MTFHRSLALFFVLALFLCGCAATVKKSGNSAPIRIGSNATKTIVLNMTGSREATESSDWEPFKGLWRQALKVEAAAINANFSAQEGEPMSTGEPGTLLVVDIADFRFLANGTRYAFGLMTGNAFVDAHVSFRDLATGSTWGEQRFDTTSTAWQAWFSPMTEKQVRAICKDVVVTLSSH